MIALSDLHSKLKLRVIWTNWSSIARQSSAARQAKQRKFANRQALIDEWLSPAEQKAFKDGSHTLFKVIKSFKTGRPKERGQLRDSQGRFLLPEEERQALEQYSRDLFGSGEDFQLSGAVGATQTSPTEVQMQLHSVKVGMAVPKGCPPVVAWQSLGSTAVQHIVDLLKAEMQKPELDSKTTSSCISWLPKPPKKPDTPASWRPTGVIAPEGKILAGLNRERLKPALKQATAGVSQFGLYRDEGFTTAGQAEGQPYP